LRVCFRDEMQRLLEARTSYTEQQAIKLRATLLVILHGESARSLSSIAIDSH
jgi:hypothetical protein